MAPAVQRGGATLYLSGQPLDHEPSLGQVPVASLAGGAGPSPPADAWLPPSHQFTRLHRGYMPPPPPPPSPGALAAAVMQGIPVPPPGAHPPPYPGGDLGGCDGVADVLQYHQQAAGSAQNSSAGRVEVF